VLARNAGNGSRLSDVVSVDLRRDGASSIKRPCVTAMCRSKSLVRALAKDSVRELASNRRRNRFESHPAGRADLQALVRTQVLAAFGNTIRYTISMCAAPTLGMPEDPFSYYYRERFRRAARQEVSPRGRGALAECAAQKKAIWVMELFVPGPGLSRARIVSGTSA